MTIFLHVKVGYVINQTIYIIASLVSTIVDIFCNAHSITYLRCFLFLLKRIYEINHFFRLMRNLIILLDCTNRIYWIKFKFTSLKTSKSMKDVSIMCVSARKIL